MRYVLARVIFFYSQLLAAEAFAQCPEIVIPYEGVMRCETEEFSKRQRLTFKWDINPCSNTERQLSSFSFFDSSQDIKYEQKYWPATLLIDTEDSHRERDVYLVKWSPPLIGFFFDSSQYPVSFVADEHNGYQSNRIMGDMWVEYKLVTGSCKFIKGKDWGKVLLKPPYRKKR